MKFTGFVKEVDKNIPSEHNFSEMFQNGNSPAEYRQTIIDYLEKGNCFGTTMSSIHDLKDGELIGGCSYYTDGVYCWPIYYTYYLKKYPNFYIDPTFYEHVRNNSRDTEILSEAQLDDIDALFSKYWSGQLQ